MSIDVPESSLTPAELAVVSNFRRDLANSIDAALAGASLETFTSTEDGIVPASGGGTDNYLRADGSWARPTAQLFNVRDYGATGDGTTDDSAAIRLTIEAVVNNGGGTVYFPNGTYVVSYSVGVAPYAGCIELRSNIRLLGESRTGAIVKLAAGQPGFTRIFTATAKSYITIESLCVDGNKGSQTPEEHMAGIFTGICTFVTIRDCIFQNCCGDGIDCWGENEDWLIENCHITANDRAGVSLNGGGQKRITIRSCQIVDNAGQQIDFEAPEGNVFDSVIDGCHLRQTNGDYSAAFTGQGEDDGLRLQGLTVVNCFFEGPVVVRWADRVRFAHNRIVTIGSDVLPALQVDGSMTASVFVGNVIEPNSLTEGLGVQVSGRSGALPDAPNGVLFIGNILKSGPNSGYQWEIDNVLDIAMYNNRIIGSATTANEGLVIRATIPERPIRRIVLSGNYIQDYTIGVMAWGYTGAGEAIEELVASGNIIAMVARASMVAWDLDADGLGVVERATIIGNDIQGCTTEWDSYPAAPMLIGGNIGAGAVYSGSGAPALTAPNGSTYIDRAGGAGTTYYGREAGVWVAK